MEGHRKNNRYRRIYDQLQGLLNEREHLIANMATIVAVLHHKMDYFFWTGFYLLYGGELVVGPYQGPVACILLKKNTGVCWAGINRGEAIIVPDVDQFPGHIACDSRSRSEIVIPFRDRSGEVSGVLDVDSRSLGAFDQVDAEWLEKITALLYKER